MTEDRDGAHHDPTPERLRRAHAHGMRPFSRSLAVSIQVFASVVCAGWAVELIGRSLKDWTRGVWTPTISGELARGSIQWLYDLLPLVGMVLGLALCCLVATLVGQMIQKGIAIPKRQLFDISQMTPFGREDSLSVGERLIFSCVWLVQLLAMAAGLFFIFRGYQQSLLSLWNTPVAVWPSHFTNVVFEMTLWMAGLMMAFSLVDYGLRRHVHWQRLRMTDNELREEMRMQEGSPERKRQLRHARSELVRKLQADSATKRVA